MTTRPIPSLISPVSKEPFDVRKKLDIVNAMQPNDTNTTPRFGQKLAAIKTTTT